MPTTYGTYSTYATGPPEPLTLDTVIKLRELMEGVPLRPFIFYSHLVPPDRILHGEMVDEIVEQAHVGFDPKREKAYMVAEHWRETIENVNLSEV